ncbi:FAD-dependent oxidoreductase [Nocardia sp. CA-129566]|uniref:FAD-dependent oxidoreductase n=1 Tax=Nocardia sp. CA-129566 TaxID=3239976 RepID=UPI003D98615D
MSIVVVGHGMAGTRLVSGIRDRDPTVPITVFGAETHLPYNRVLLSDVLAGRTRPDQIGLLQPDWYDAHEVTVNLGVQVTHIDRDAKKVVASNGTVTAFDTLVLATGSTAIVPPVAGIGADGRLPRGAMALRTIDDCIDIMAADRARHCVVIGGGLLGVEAARALAGRGLTVTIAHRARHLMERHLDPVAGRILAHTLEGLGIAARTGAQVTGLRTEMREFETPTARVTGVELAGGEVLNADLVVFACGVKPQTSLAVAAGLAVDRGIVVDSELRSVTDPSIRALGECAEHDQTVYGLVAPVWEQAAVLAELLTDADSTVRYRGSRLVTRLKASDIDLATVGESSRRNDDHAAEIVQLVDAARGIYKKLVIENDRLAGAILLGDASTIGAITQLYDNAAPTPADRIGLLVADTSRSYDEPARGDDSATVCHCNNVPKGQIVRALHGSARTVEDVMASTRAGTGCGTCRNVVERIVVEFAKV